MKEFLGEKRTKAQVADFFGALRITATTEDILRSSTAEDEIKPRLPVPPEVVRQRKKAADDYLKTLQ